MTNRRKKEIEKLAREKAFTLVFGDTFSAVETDLITRQLAIAEPGSPDESDPDETANTAPDETPPPTGSDEMEVYHRGIISELVKEAKASRAAILDIVKYIFGLSPDETAAFLLKRSGGAFGTIEYSDLTDAVRELSKLPEVAAIREVLKHTVRPRREKIPHGMIKEARKIVKFCGMDVPERTFRRWVNREAGTPVSFPGITDTEKLIRWASEYDWKPQKRKRTISGLSEEQQHQNRH